MYTLEKYTSDTEAKLVFDNLNDKNSPQSINFSNGVFKINGDAILTAGTSTTSSLLASLISDESGSGSLVFATAPTLVAPVLGEASATSLSVNTISAGTVSATTLTTDIAAANIAMSGTTIQAGGTDSTANVNIASKSTGSVVIKTNGSDRWTVNGSGSLNPASDNTLDIGNLSVNPRDICVSRSLIKKGIGFTAGYGQLAIKSISASKTLTNAQTNTLSLQIPSGAAIIGVQLRNDTLIAGVDDATGLVAITSYSAIYATGATQTINTTVALTANTKVNKFFDTNAATNITTGLTDITLDAGSGNKFTIGGIISAVAYYYELTSITDL